MGSAGHRIAGHRHVVDGRAGGAVGGEEEAEIGRRQAVTADGVSAEGVEGVHLVGKVGLDVEDVQTDLVEAVALNGDVRGGGEGDPVPADVAEGVVVDPDRVGRDVGGVVPAHVDAVAPGMADRVVSDLDVGATPDADPVLVLLAGGVERRRVWVAPDEGEVLDGDVAVALVEVEGATEPR